MMNLKQVEEVDKEWDLPARDYTGYEQKEFVARRSQAMVVEDLIGG